LSFRQTGARYALLVANAFLRIAAIRRNHIAGGVREFVQYHLKLAFAHGHAVKRSASEKFAWAKAYARLEALPELRAAAPARVYVHLRRLCANAISERFEQFDWIVTSARK
jgi:hypothetical protein